MNVGFQEFSRWDFANVDGTVTIRVDGESVTLLFTDYDRFENAEPHYRKILAMVENAIPALLPQMVRLCYVANIPLTQDSPPTDWVVQSVLGVVNLGDLSRQGACQNSRDFSV